MSVLNTYNVKYFIKKLILKYSDCKVNVVIPGMSENTFAGSKLVDGHELAKILKNSYIEDARIIEWGEFPNNEDNSIQVFISWQNEIGNCTASIFKEKL